MCPEISKSEKSVVTPKAKAKKAKAKAKKVVKKTTKAKPETDSSHDGSVVGFGAKSQEDVRWSKLKVAFYKAIKKVGGAGTSAAIAKASGGKINAGHVRHFGYHGVGSGLTSVEAAGGPNSKEGDRGFIFVLTAKGRKCDPDVALQKQESDK